MNNASPFTQIEDNFGYGSNPPAGWVNLPQTAPLILVGVTGVGKSRTVEELIAQGLALTVLPNRRLLTDKLIIDKLQRLDGVAANEDGSMPTVRDRKARFAYTRRYREQYLGGMAHALSRLWVSPTVAQGPLLFDGLRGVDEVAWAANHLPHAKFVALCAPDGLRIQRLLGRNDAFDQIAAGSASLDQTEPGEAVSSEQAQTLANHFPDIGLLNLFPAEEKTLLQLLTDGGVSVEEMAAKVAIVVEERRNYDPDAALVSLKKHAPKRLCIVDTAANRPPACAQQIIEWLQKSTSISKPSMV